MLPRLAVLRSPRPLQTLTRGIAGATAKPEDGELTVSARKQQAVSYARISRRYPMYVGQLSMEAVDRTARFLRNRGLSQTQALRAISLQVTMCRYTPEMMERKIEWLGNLGLSHDKINLIIRRFPHIFGFSLEKYEATVDWFLSKGVPQSKIPYVFTVFPHGVSFKPADNLDQKLDALKEIGCDDAQIARILTMAPQMLSHSADKLQGNAIYLAELGVPTQKLPCILARVPACLGLSLARIQETVDMLEEMFGAGAGVRALTWNPVIVMHNIGGLRRSFNYLVSIGFTKERLEKNTRLITRSASRFLRPRAQFLQSKGVDVVARTAWINTPESAFKEDYPDYEVYLMEYKTRQKNRTASAH
ncbi:hypothetical protein PF008_g15679 [Phytophthora fragariae]|uniref:Uncharacterized protein n=1 Tax=Phytophthora fragariae TaxID=53985 RepID=A0A6G0RE83_9STRA|nr:hypothetical protein PF008_g15679 [Phytophthora fragariae]